MCWSHGELSWRFSTVIVVIKCLAPWAALVGVDAGSETQQT